MTNQHVALQPFHLAVAVDCLRKAREFYGQLLGLREGRSSDHWIDWDFWGHQFVTHLAPELAGRLQHNDVDDHAVPVPHFGVVLSWQDWQQLAERLRQTSIEFVIQPYIRFRGLPGEQATMFFYDPAGNALEFKAFQNPEQLFAKQ